MIASFVYVPETNAINYVAKRTMNRTRRHSIENTKVDVSFSFKFHEYDVETGLL